MASCASACTKRGLAWTMASVLMNEVGIWEGPFMAASFGGLVKGGFFVLIPVVFTKHFEKTWRRLGTRGVGESVFTPERSSS